MAIDDNFFDMREIFDIIPGFNREIKKDREWKSNVSIEHLIVDEELKKDIINFCERKDVHNPNYWIEKNQVMKQYRHQCAEHLMNKYDWPKWVAKSVAKTVRIPRKNISFADVIAAYFVGSLPTRYVEPVAKLMGADRKFYTTINIIADAAWLGISAYSLYVLKDNSVTTLMNDAYHLANNTLAENTLYINTAIRAIQIPLRTISNMKGKHTWSPASLITPFIPEAITFGVIIGHDYGLKIKNHYKKLKNKDNFLNHS